MSSNDFSIQVRNLGKKYRIGGSKERYHTFRDAIINSIKSPFQKNASLYSQTEFWALKDVSFDIMPGEVVGIIGRNGAGKSTLLKILSRITLPSEGKVDLYGRVGSLLEVGTGFHPELTGRENIFLSGSILGMKKRDIEDKFDDIIKFSEIEKFIETPVKRYSSGMYVRLAFAVAAHLEPEILLIDEVLAVGDMSFQKKCLGKMGEVAKEGRTVLFVSHNLSAITQLCTHGILLNAGQIELNSTANEVVKQYLKGAKSILPEISFSIDSNKSAQFLYACIKNNDDTVSLNYSCDEPISIVAQFELKKEMRDLYFGVTIQTLEGIQVLYSDIRDDGNSSNHEMHIGINVLTLTIPPRLLGSGDYIFKIDAAIPQQGMIDSTDFICNFNIKDFRTYRGDRRPGYFSVILPWNIERWKNNS